MHETHFSELNFLYASSVVYNFLSFSLWQLLIDSEWEVLFHSLWEKQSVNEEDDIVDWFYKEYSWTDAKTAIKSCHRSILDFPRKYNSSLNAGFF